MRWPGATFEKVVLDNLVRNRLLKPVQTITLCLTPSWRSRSARHQNIVSARWSKERHTSGSGAAPRRTKTANNYKCQQRRRRGRMDKKSKHSVFDAMTRPAPWDKCVCLPSRGVGRKCHLASPNLPHLKVRHTWHEEFNGLTREKERWDEMVTPGDRLLRSVTSSRLPVSSRQPTRRLLCDVTASVTEYTQVLLSTKEKVFHHPPHHRRLLWRREKQPGEKKKIYQLVTLIRTPPPPHFYFGCFFARQKLLHPPKRVAAKVRKTATTWASREKNKKKLRNMVDGRLFCHSYLQNDSHGQTGWSSLNGRVLFFFVWQWRWPVTSQ